MSTSRPRPRYSNNRHRPWTHVLIAIAVIATFLRVWFGPVSMNARAMAQIPDSGLQRKLMLEELRLTNQILGEMHKLLTSHTFNVRISGADNQADQRAHRARDKNK